jgi:hypothetical protein
VPRLPALISVAAAVTLAAGCGNDATKPPKASKPTVADAWTTVSFTKQGVSFERPTEWHYAAGTTPLLATITSGNATIAVWRYPRSEILPSTPDELNAARDALIAAAKTRDKTFAVKQAKATRAAHHPAVVIVADETVAGRARMVRSTHVYGDGGEVVIDAFAPQRIYPMLEAPIFRRVVHSLKVGPPR